MGFFDWLFQRNGQLVSYMQVLEEDLAKLNASKFALHKCIGIIGNAIAKSEIVIQGQNGPRYDHNYYRLNISPNDNERGTEFWARVTLELLLNQQALIVPIKDMYYLAETWTESDDVIKAREYSQVVVTAGGKTYPINKRFRADQVIHIRLPMSADRMHYFQKVAELYDHAVSVANAVYKLTYTPKWAVRVGASVRLVEQQADGTGKVLTGREYMDKIKAMLVSDKLETILLPDGVNVDLLTGSSGTATVSSIDSAIKAAEEACARAFDIPTAVYFGTITEKSDATNELITYAVSPVAEAINDALTSSLVGMQDYVNRNERVMVFLARFKHIDIIDSADKLSKMRGDGWTMDEIFHLIGYPEMHTDFTTTRALTKNYAAADAGGAADASESGSGALNRKSPGTAPEKGDAAQ